MKKAFALFGLLSGALLATLYADSKPGYQKATIVSVMTYEATSNYVGDNPSDAPLRPTEYVIDIGVRLGCYVYVGRYDSAIDYLPTALAPNRTVDVRLDKYVMSINSPADREVKMGIVRQNPIKDGTCIAGN